MTASDERQSLHRIAEEKGWQRVDRDRDRVDVYVRGASRIRVIWRGDDAISGASVFQDDNLTLYTRRLADVTGWLGR